MSHSFYNLATQSNVAEILKSGSSDKASIRKLQTALNELGFGTLLSWQQFGADGIYGNGTSQAVAAFAKLAGLPSDGKSVSPALANLIVIRHQAAQPLRTLDKISAPADELKRGKKGSKVEALQWLLKYLGFENELNWARFGADGDYGGSTTAAVKAFAQQKNVASDGSSVSAALKEAILTAVAPDLGPDWKTVKDSSAHRRRGKSQYGMRSSRLHDDVVANFKNSLKFEALGVELEEDKMDLEFHQVSRTDGNGRYQFDERVQKKKVVLHFTAGHIMGDLSTLTKPAVNPISTAFVIGYDGTIYRLFGHVEFWAWHLGSGALGSNTAMSPTSVGIEVSNWGPLREENGDLVSWDHGHFFCTLDDVEAYTKLSAPYRGAQYFAKPTDLQYDSVILLLRYLTETKSNSEEEQTFVPVKRAFMPEGTRGDLFASGQAAKDFEGICCHTNFRPTGKWDYPEEGFDWKRVVDGVMGPLPAHLKRSRSLFGGPEIVSERGLADKMSYLDCAKPDPSTWGEDGPEVDI